MSFLISHPPGYSYISPTEVPEGFVIKCYAVPKYNDNGIGTNEIDHWEIDYDLLNQSVEGLLRYTKFKTFEEASIKCSLLGLKCIESRWLRLPMSKGKDGHWYMRWCSIPHFGEVLVPVKSFDKEMERIYREHLGEFYDEYMEMIKSGQKKSRAKHSHDH